MIDELKLDTRPIAIVDVDLTAVDSVTPWLAWLNAKTGQNFTPEQLGYEYNLGKVFKPFWPSYCTEQPLDWWRYEGIYDMLQPYEGAVDALREISQTHQIVFVSHCKGRHMKSKVSFLKKHFPFMSGFLATKQKQFVASMDPRRDIVIDDRHEHLNKFLHRHCVPFKMHTKWSQTENLLIDATVCLSWKELMEHYRAEFVNRLQPCKRCGIVGLHACLGDRLVNHRLPELQKDTGIEYMQHNFTCVRK